MASPCHGTRPHAGLCDLKKKKCLIQYLRVMVSGPSYITSLILEIKQHMQMCRQIFFTFSHTFNFIGFDI